MKGRAQKFQSLIGFKINWNASITVRCPNLVVFQSLIGFKINWNLPTQIEIKYFDKVSIPNRV